MFQKPELNGWLSWPSRMVMKYVWFNGNFLRRRGLWGLPDRCFLIPFLLAFCLKSMMMRELSQENIEVAIETMVEGARIDYINGSDVRAFLINIAHHFIWGFLSVRVNGFFTHCRSVSRLLEFFWLWGPFLAEGVHVLLWQNLQDCKSNLRGQLQHLHEIPPSHCLWPWSAPLFSSLRGRGDEWAIKAKKGGRILQSAPGKFNCSSFFKTFKIRRYFH